MNFKCDFPNCREIILKSYLCLKCKEKFCSDQCKINHSFKIHNPTIIEIKEPNKRNSHTKSSYMKSGQYLREIKDDPIYEFKNFQFLKSKNTNQVLGSGAFGDVLLARNIINNNLFAIKQMKKNKIIENGALFDIVMREIDVHRRLIHDNIVRMYSHHEDKEAFYIVKFMLILGNGLCHWWNII